MDTKLEIIMFLYSQKPTLFKLNTLHLQLNPYDLLHFDLMRNHTWLLKSVYDYCIKYQVFVIYFYIL